MIEILDCTLRDGGYYTNWDFSDELIKKYFNGVANLPIKYLEVGYRSPSKDSYFGEYFYCTKSTLSKIKNLIGDKQIVIILNEKDIELDQLQSLLDSCQDYVDMVRLAIDPKNIKRAMLLVDPIHQMGFKVAFNVMYMSKWSELSTFYQDIKDLNDLPLSYFYLVDSYGSVTPNEVRSVIEKVKSVTSTPLGFHGHNNIELALINTITAIEAGVDIVDSTITGMGRGAGNLSTELLLTYLSKYNGYNVDFHGFSSCIDSFQELKEFYRWGTSLPYMVSGAYSLPQKDVMDLFGKRRYSINDIIQSMGVNTGGYKDDYSNIPPISLPRDRDVLVVGGGPSVGQHFNAIKELVLTKDFIVICSSTRYVNEFRNAGIMAYYVLYGNEFTRYLKIVEQKSTDDKFIIFETGGALGVYFTEAIKDQVFSFPEKDIIYPPISGLTLSLEVARNINSNQVYLVGFDGYANDKSGLSKSDYDIAEENQKVFLEYGKVIDQIISLLPTMYKVDSYHSIYTFLE
jgi:4-hydroxy 2-oxovalerate aldolase